MAIVVHDYGNIFRNIFLRILVINFYVSMVMRYKSVHLYLCVIYAWFQF